MEILKQIENDLVPVYEQTPERKWFTEQSCLKK
jgi:hypothetical protein